MQGTTALGLINQRGYILVHDGRITEYDNKFLKKPGQKASPPEVVDEFCRKRLMVIPHVHGVYAGNVSLAQQVCRDARARSLEIGLTSVQDVGTFIGRRLLNDWSNHGAVPCGLIIGGFEGETPRMVKVDVAFHGKEGNKRPHLWQSRLIPNVGAQFVSMAHSETVDKCLEGYTYYSTIEDTAAMIKNAMREGAKVDIHTGDHAEAVLYTHDGQFYNIFTTPIEGMEKLVRLGVSTSKVDDEE